MKSFLNIYAVLLVLVEVGFFFGLPLLLQYNYYAAGALLALALAAPVGAFIRLETKLEDLEKRLRDMENKENQT